MISMTDVLVSRVGSGWRFQTFLFILCCSHQLFLCFNNVVMVLYHMTPEHHCEVPDDLPLNLSLPMLNKDDMKEHPYEPCDVFVNPYNHSEGVQQCTSYTYYTTKQEETIVKEWNLVCQRKYLVPFSSTMYFLGMTFGSLVTGHLADRFGRRPTILVCVYAQALIGVALYFIDQMRYFLVMRFLLGIATQGNTGTSLTLLMEMSPGPNRGYVGVGWSMVWSLGVLTFGIVAYFVRQWRTIQLMISLPILASCVYSWFFPESLRWLLSMGKTKAAKETAIKIARLNGSGEITDLDEIIENSRREIEKSGKSKKKYNYHHLVKTPELRKRCLITCYTKFAMSVCYYGILLNVTDLSGDRYLNFVIGAALELAVKIITMMVINKIQRKKLFIVTTVIAAVMCIAGGVVMRVSPSDGMASTMLILGCKAMLVASFGAVLLIINECFPTVCRNMGSGAVTLSLRIGGILSPQFITLGEYTDTSIPFVIYGVLVFIAAASMGFIDETKDHPLPDTIEEIENKRNKQDQQEMAQL